VRRSIALAGLLVAQVWCAWWLTSAPPAPEVPLELSVDAPGQTVKVYIWDQPPTGKALVLSTGSTSIVELKATVSGSDYLGASAPSPQNPPGGRCKQKRADAQSGAPESPVYQCRFLIPPGEDVVLIANGGKPWVTRRGARHSVLSPFVEPKENESGPPTKVQVAFSPTLPEAASVVSGPPFASVVSGRVGNAFYWEWDGSGRVQAPLVQDETGARREQLELFLLAALLSLTVYALAVNLVAAFGTRSARRGGERRRHS